MKVGLIDVDGHNYPNLPLMKLSAYHKSIGDEVGWYDGTHVDRVYMSKVFSFTPDYDKDILADEVIRGGSGYSIKTVNGLEVYDTASDAHLPYHVEHIYPDYDLYGISDTAYGFMSRGCPRGCRFCHVKSKEGLRSVKVADLSEFWNGQKNIILSDPNTLACKDWKDILTQLADSGAKVEFNQGIDIRLMTEEKIEYLNRIRLVKPHFAWDSYSDKEIILPKLELASRLMKINRRQCSVYVLTNFDSTLEQDIERAETIRSLGFCPYIMRYDRKSLKNGHPLNRLARWCNKRLFLWKYGSFAEYLEHEPETH